MLSEKEQKAITKEPEREFDNKKNARSGKKPSYLRDYEMSISKLCQRI